MLLQTFLLRFALYRIVKHRRHKSTVMTAARRTARFGLSFEFLSDPWLCAHQQAAEKVNPATVQRRSAAAADAFTPPFTPISSACARLREHIMVMV